MQQQVFANIACLVEPNANCQCSRLAVAMTVSDTMQVEDKEGETPLSMAAKHGKLRDLMVQVATGKMDVDEVL